MKYLIMIFLVAAVIAGCTSQQPTTTAPSIQEVQQQPQETTPEAQQQQAEEADEQAQPEVKTFEMTAKQWEFIPDTITVSKGDAVRLIINSIDVAHGIAITEFGINERLEPGKVTEVEFVADKTGTFTFYCSVFCGSGHGSMRGTLIVK
jgi:cytochrome c oxidase subunit 2